MTNGTGVTVPFFSYVGGLEITNSLSEINLNLGNTGHSESSLHRGCEKHSSMASTVLELACPIPDVLYIIYFVRG